LLQEPPNSPSPYLLTLYFSFHEYHFASSKVSFASKCCPNFSLYQTCNVNSRKLTLNTHQLDLLQPIQQKLDAIEIHNPKLAQLLCRVIPASCPFEHDVRLFGHLIAHIPPLCKLNPLYKQLVELRFRALYYLFQH